MPLELCVFFNLTRKTKQFSLIKLENSIIVGFMFEYCAQSAQNKKKIHLKSEWVLNRRKPLQSYSERADEQMLGDPCIL